jgi:hypothetical protein
MRSIHLVLLATMLLCVKPAFAAEGEDAQSFTLGPVMMSFMERVESHSNAPQADGTYGNNTYILSTFIVSREIGEDVTGIFTYTNKYGTDENTSLTDIGTLMINRKISDRWNASLSYTNVTNPKATIAGLERPMSTSDWFALSSDYVLFASSKRSWKTGLSFTTGTGFNAGQMLTGRIALRTKMNAKMDCELAYQIIYGLHDDPARQEYNDLYAHHYQFTFGYKLDKDTKLQLAYLYLANRYPGNPGNDGTMRVTAYRMFKTR